MVKIHRLPPHERVELAAGNPLAMATFDSPAPAAPALPPDPLAPEPPGPPPPSFAAAGIWPFFSQF